MARNRSVLAVAVLAAGMLVASAPPASAAGPTMTLSQSAGLLDGQFVRVDLQNLPPQTGVSYKQCQSNATIATAGVTCTANYPITGVTDMNGSGTTYLPIRTTGNSDLVSQDSTWLVAGGAGNSYGALNLIHDAAASLVSSVSAGSVRNDFNGLVGMQYTTGSAPLSVTQLGRMFISGNNHQHLVGIYPKGTASPLASCTVDNTAGSPDSLGFKYCTLSSPFTLAAATTYVIASTEVNNEDSWLDAKSTKVSVAVGTVAGGVAWQQLPLTCGYGHSCLLVGIYISGTQRVILFQQITFAPTPSDCPPSQGGGVLGSGAATAYRAIYGWEAVTCLPPLNLPVDYALSNSVDGIANIGSGTDFGMAGPLGPTHTCSAPLTSGCMYAPITTSALVLAYRIYDGRGPLVTTLTLTPSLIAKLFLGKIGNWNTYQPEAVQIRNLNPGIQFPSKMAVIARAEHSSETYVFTSWLAANAPNDWVNTTTNASGTRIATPIGVTDTWPYANGVLSIQGSSFEAMQVMDTGYLGTQTGSIAYMDSSTAAFLGLPTVRILRPDGSVTAATPSTIAQAIADSKLNSDGTITTDYTNPDPLAYPMPMPTYMLVPKNITPDKGVALAPFIAYAVQASLGQSNLPPGYAPLSDSLRAVSMQVSAAIPVSAPPQPSPSPTPAPPSASSPSLPPPDFGSLPSGSEGTSGGIGGGGSLPGRTSTGGRLPCPKPGAAVASSARSGTPSPSPAGVTSASGARTATPDYCLPLGHISDNQGALVSWVVQSGDPSPARYIVPGVGGLGLLALALGAIAQLIAWRGRRILAMRDAPPSPPRPSEALASG